MTTRACPRCGSQTLAGVRCHRCMVDSERALAEAQARRANAVDLGLLRGLHALAHAGLIRVEITEAGREMLAGEG